MASGYQKWKEVGEKLFGRTDYRSMQDLENLTLEKLKERYETAQLWIDCESQKNEQDRQPNYEFQLKRFERIRELIEQKETEEAFL